MLTYGTEDTGRGEISGGQRVEDLRTGVEFWGSVKGIPRKNQRGPLHTTWDDTRESGKGS